MRKVSKRQRDTHFEIISDDIASAGDVSTDRRTPRGSPLSPQQRGD